MIKHKLRSLLVGILFLIGTTFTVVALPTPVYAEGSTCQCTNTYSDGSVKQTEGSESIFFGDTNGCYCGGAQGILRIATDIFTGLIVLAATVGIIIAGAQYLAARDNEEQVVKAKKRLVNVIIGIIAFALLDVIANLIQPGGLNSAPTIANSVSSRLVAKVEVTPSKQTYKQPAKNYVWKKNDDPDYYDITHPEETQCQDGAKTVSPAKYYWQFASDVGNIRWKGGTCPGSSSNWRPNNKIGASGCPMIASLNAINQATGCGYTPQMFASHMKKYTNNYTNRKGLFAADDCWSNTGYPIVLHYAQAYNVHSKMITKDQVKTALKKGHPVVVSGGGSGYSGSVFSEGGHFVLFSKYNKNTNRVTVINPARGTVKQDFDFDTALVRSKKYIEIWN